MRKMFLIAATLAFPLIVAFPLTSGIAAGTRTSTVPARLVGTWGKTVTLATWHKAGVYGDPGGHWRIKINKAGLTTLFAPPPPVGYALTTMPASTSGTSVVFGPTADKVCPGKASYTWKVSGSTLVFEVVKDGCIPRRVLLTAGTWKRG